jgi:hypothetical protein
MGCGVATSDEPHASAAMVPALVENDFSHDWIRLPLPAGAEIGQRESLVKTHDGYAALYRRQLGEGKAVFGWENRVFVSDDGVHWSEHSVSLAPAAFYRSLAFGDGRFVLGGARGGLEGIIATSSDAAEWQTEAAPSDDVSAVAFVNGQFFALSNRMSISRSSDGAHWVESATQTIQLQAIAYGNGTYVAVGSGPIEVSRDGAQWSPVALDCAVPDNCVTDPSGGVHQGYTTHVFYAEGAFYADALVSRDALHWERTTNAARVPNTHYGGFFLRGYPDTLEAWRTADIEPRHVQLRAHADTDSSCAASRCIIVGLDLLLVP